MKKTILALTFAVGLTSFAGSAQASITYTETKSFLTDFTVFSDEQTNQYLYFDNGNKATYTVNPFNTSLGTLESASIKWEFGGSFSGSTGQNGGQVVYGIEGASYLGTVNLGGGAGGGGNGAGPYSAFVSTQDKFTISSPVFSSSSTYYFGEWDTLSGSSAYDVTFDSRIDSYANFRGIASGDLTTYRDVTVSYTYAPGTAAVPEPSQVAASILLIGSIAGFVIVRRRKESALAPTA